MVQVWTWFGSGLDQGMHGYKLEMMGKLQHRHVKSFMQYGGVLVHLWLGLQGSRLVHDLLQVWTEEMVMCSGGSKVVVVARGGGRGV